MVAPADPIILLGANEVIDTDSDWRQFPCQDPA
jgi:hypothetical protein